MKMTREYSILCFLLYIITRVESQSTCMINGIDLSPLTITSGNYYTATYPNNGDIFYWNICGTVSNSYCTTLSGTSVCELSGGKYWSCGLYSTQIFSRLFLFKKQLTIQIINTYFNREPKQFHNHSVVYRRGHVYWNIWTTKEIDINSTYLLK